MGKIQDDTRDLRGRNDNSQRRGQAALHRLQGEGGPSPPRIPRGRAAQGNGVHVFILLIAETGPCDMQ
jgi:hypothetical protein